jgi:hypothetical protein
VLYDESLMIAAAADSSIGMSKTLHLEVRRLKP